VLLRFRRLGALTILNNRISDVVLQTDEVDRNDQTFGQWLRDASLPFDAKRMIFGGF